MIQDIEPKKLYNEYDVNAKMTAEDYVLVYRDKHVLAKVDGRDLALPRANDFGFAEPDLPEAIYLLALDEERFFLLKEDPEIPEGYEFVEMFALNMEHYDSKALMFTALTGYQLANWYKDNKYCGTCGSKTTLSKTERAIVCPECGRTIYPRILPACIIGVTYGDKLLHTRYAHGAYRRYALIAGFTEIGESLEGTVAREVKEEVNLDVTNIRYYKSQPWGIVDDLLCGFYCEAVGELNIELDDELSEAVWISRDEIPAELDDFSLTNEMMVVFKEGREPK